MPSQRTANPVGSGRGKSSFTVRPAAASRRGLSGESSGSKGMVCPYLKYDWSLPNLGGDRCAATGAALDESDVEQGIVCDFEHERCRHYREAEIEDIEGRFKSAK